MRIRYEKPKGNRMKKQMWGISCISDNDECYTYSDYNRKFMPYDDIKEGCACSHCHCRSLKSAIRILKKSNLPKGLTFCVDSIFYGYNIYITT